MELADCSLPRLIGAKPGIHVHNKAEPEPQLYSSFSTRSPVPVLRLSRRTVLRMVIRIKARSACTGNMNGTGR
ncbi:hypothetical protein D3C80_1864100 [compost metagenome]